MKKQSNNKSNMKKMVTAGAVTVVLAGGLGFQTYQVHQLGEDLTKVEKKYSQTVQSLDKATEKYDDLLVSNQEMEKQVVDLKENVNTLESNVDTLKKSNASLQKKADERQSIIDNKDSEISRLRSKINRLSATSTSTNAKTVSAKQPTKKPTAQNVKATYHMKATAYTTAANGDPYTSGKWGNLTASGTTVKQGRTIAVDKNLIPLGTKVRLTFPDGWEHLNGLYIAEDTGNYIKNMKIDIYFDSYQTCVQFGRQTVKLEVLR